MKASFWCGLAALLAGLSAAPASWAATAVSIAYTWPDFSSNQAYVVDWRNKGKAHVGAPQGGADGSFTDDGVQRVLTVATPLSVTFDSVDCNGNLFQQRNDTTQIVFRRGTGTDRRGTNQVVEIGTTTDLGGCTPGLVTPYGSLTDPGTTYNNLSLAARPPITDLVPGAQLAGYTLDDFDPVNGSALTTADTVTFGAGTLTFERSAIVLPYTVVNDWVSYTANGGIDRRYARLSRSATSGIELWLASDFVAGQYGKTELLLASKPTAGATFGSVKRSAHEWNSGLFIGASSGLYWDLYTDFTGQRVLRNPDGTTTPQPITWAQSGNDIVTTRITGTTQRVRTWVPIGTYGKNHFVFESERWYLADGSTFDLILPRVNYYVDQGVAVPPVSPPAAACNHCGSDGSSGAARTLR